MKRKFSSDNGVKQNRQMMVVIASIIFVLLVGSAIVVRQSYQANLGPVSGDKTKHVVTIAPGSTTAVIADSLKSKGVIKSDWAFEWYVRNHELRDELKAGTYLFSPSQGVSEIVSTLVDGKVATDLVTILPAQRLDQVRASFIKAGFSAQDVDTALDPAQYASHPALRDKPKEASLEGYLYPESFQKTGETKPSDIIRLSLDEMNLRLTADIRQAISKQGLTLHQAVIFASIVEKEVSNGADRPQVAQVFLDRQKDGMMLGSDVTAFYGAIMAGQAPSVLFDSPYNTRIHAGLPPGPISNVSNSSLKAVAFPAQTDWVYFVAGDDGKTYFSKTLTEHEALTAQHCKRLCSE